MMVALRGTKIVSVPFSEALVATRPVDPDLLDVARGLRDRREMKNGS